jgi:hypothetical protein
MRIAQLCAAFPLTLRPYDRLVHDAGNINAFEWRNIRRVYHVVVSGRRPMYSVLGDMNQLNIIHPRLCRKVMAVMATVKRTCT